MPSRWQAEFVTPAFANGVQPDDPAPYLRGEVVVEDPPRRATLYATAIGLVEPYLNGTRIGDEVLAPGWTSYRHRLRVSEYDVTELVTPGANAFGGILGQGWALGRIGYDHRRNHYADRPALFLQLELEYADRTEVFGTGDGFRAGLGGVGANGIYDGETYDARSEPLGWSRPGFDDSGWSPVQVVDWPREALFTTDAPPIRRIEELAPTAITTRPSGRMIVDFGQNISGWVRLAVSGEAGRTVTLRHAEVLTGDGELETETLRTAAATDRYTLAGTGTEVWEPRFTFHGFRYVEVDGYPGEVTPESVTAVVVHSDMTRTGWFSTSNPLLDQLHSNVVWSMRDNFVGVPTDCPQRDERLGWTGDLNAFAPTAAFLYDVRGVLGEWLDDLAVEQAEKGYVPWVVPDVLANPCAPTALWSDVVVSLPWMLYREYGEHDGLRRAYPPMIRFLRDVEGRLDAHGLWSTGYQFGDWLDPDAPMNNAAGGKTDRHLVAAAYLCKTTREAAEAAELLGEGTDATWLTALHDRVRAAFRREYVTEAGRVVNESATAYALALCFDILDEEQRATAGARLAELVAKAGYRISTGFAGTPLVCDALSSTGHLDEAYLLLLETGCPSFLYPVTQGATTIWERWDSIRPDGTINPSGMTSLNHYALGAVADWMHRTIGGLSAVEPGYRRMRIAPQPGGGLTHASVTHDTVHGRVAVSWRIDEGRAAVDVRVPAGTTATVVLPLHPDGLVLEVSGGSHRWEYAVPQSEPTEFTMDTPLSVLATDPAVWRSVTDVFAKHFPGIPIDGSSPEAAGVSLNTVLQFVPGASAELEADLAASLHPAAV
ncbi:glycoside hydrolase family 78 protein [Cryptosporangium minutisporangium]|uniref:alpha-L-rhamnosidase n=1 Tax=Cryptosporangium minutisporangium TaxID=113569 RepID=A0ABP6SS44_9ACTN